MSGITDLSTNEIVDKWIPRGRKAGRDHGALATTIGMSIGAIAITPIGLFHSGLVLFSPSILVLYRARVLFRFKEMLDRNSKRLAQIISEEHGKTLDDAG
jgi:hypothetical protein